MRPPWYYEFRTKLLGGSVSGSRVGGTFVVCGLCVLPDDPIDDAVCGNAAHPVRTPSDAHDWIVEHDARHEFERVIPEVIAHAHKVSQP